MAEGGTVKPNKAPVPVYHDGVRCPACTQTNWLVGRLMAECANCFYPLVLSGTVLHPGSNL
jgi:hypothetical protein